MLGKLLKYDFAFLAKPLGILQIIAIGVAIVATVCGFAGYWIGEIDGIRLELLTAFAFMGVGFGFIGLVCLVPATFVIVLYRLYSNFFTDQGYLTFTLPVKASELLWSKLIAGLIWLMISAIVVFFGMVVIGAGSSGFVYGLDIDDSIPYWVLSVSSNWYTGDSNNFFSVFFGIIGSILSITAALITAYMGFTLGSVWAGKHKLACGIALFVGIYCGIGIISSVPDVIITISLSDFFYDAGFYSAVGWVLYGLHILRDATVCIVGFCITLFCLNKHLNLS